ncbi:hypothetical protein [Ketobacter sp.]
MNAKYERYKAIEYIGEYFTKYRDVSVLELHDFNEEFPLCCAEVFAKLRIKSNTLELSDLNIDTFYNGARFMIFAVNGWRLECSFEGGRTSMGIDALSFPDDEYRKIQIRSVEDILLKSDEFFAYFSGWPESPSNGISVNDDSDAKKEVKLCYLGHEI